MLILIGNSLSDIAERTNNGQASGTRQLVDSEMLEEYEMLQLPKSEYECAPGNLFGAFNDTAVHRIGGLSSKAEWPDLQVCPTDKIDDPEIVT